LDCDVCRAYMLASTCDADMLRLGFAIDKEAYHWSVVAWVHECAEFPH